jgi:hypothetical protein
VFAAIESDYNRQRSHFACGCRSREQMEHAVAGSLSIKLGEDQFGLVKVSYTS